MDDTRSGQNADGEAATGYTPTWTWPDQQERGQPDAHASHASSEHETPRTVHHDWSSTSGFSSQRANSAHSQSAYSAADASSWATKSEPESAGARTPADDWDRYDDLHEGYYEQINEQFANDQRRPTPQEAEQARFRRMYKARTCRICLEVIEPTFSFDADDEHADDAPGAGVGENGVIGAVAAGFGRRVVDKITSVLPPSLQPAAISASISNMTARKPSVKYISEDPNDGRLFSPCHCKGSQKYVHDGCLQRWRFAQPVAGNRNFWTCPTCGFEYRMQRLTWGRYISSRFTRAILTVTAFILTLFILGFIADPLMDLWSDPAGTVMGSLSDLNDYDDDLPILSGIWNMFSGSNTKHTVFEEDLDLDLESTWFGHFLKGFFSLGIVGVLKTALMVSPFTWWNLRGAGMGRGRRRAAGGRDRFDNMGWVFIFIGAATFLGAVWKGMDYLSGRLLDRARDGIVDIGGGGPDVDEDEDVPEGHLHTE